MNNEKFMVQAGVMLNAYPDSIGGTISDISKFLSNPMLEGAFQAFYILPSIFNTDLDRGFSVIDYEINEMYSTRSELEVLKNKGLKYKFDFILNHLSVLSKQFQDVLRKGEDSVYKDFFINWNKFWEGNGELTEDGYIQPDDELINDMFFRKPGLPILSVRMPDGKEVPYWNTFYQEVKYPKIDAQDIMKLVDVQYTGAQKISNIVNQAIKNGIKPKNVDLGRFETYKPVIVDLLESNRKYLGQMDLNIKSPLVWGFYEDTLKKLSDYGADIVRLDAFAYAPKEPGEKNFLNEPGTWDILAKVNTLAAKNNLTLLPEIHSMYGEKIHEKVSNKGYITYDFFLPGLIIYSFDSKDFRYLNKWLEDIREKNIRTVNMLGCHDGIPLLDLKGLLPDEKIEMLIQTVVDRGGYVKDLHGKKNMYYQVNATYYSALGEDDKKMVLARAIQMFMPGIPQVWYLDLFAGKNNYKAVEDAGSDGHKEINRTNIPLEVAESDLSRKVVKDQLELFKFRNAFPAFGFDAKFTVLPTVNSVFKIRWENNGCETMLEANAEDYSFEITGNDKEGNEVNLNV